MSTSPSRARVNLAADKLGSFSPQPFPYNTILAGVGSAAMARAPGTVIQSPDESPADADREHLARAQGRQEGQAEERRIWIDRLEKERLNVVEALSLFSRDRGAYFRQVEGEVVRLALGIARKILHRESQIDPLLLAGIVRVTLEKLDGATKVTLRLHPRNTADWRKYLQEQLDPAHVPEIVEDPSQPADRCILETSMGIAVMSLDEQLQEIEKGFLDLLSARPGEHS